MTALFRVIQNEAGIWIDAGERGSLQVMLDGGPAILGAGWSAQDAFAGFTPLLLLDLLHTNGQRALWILDQAGTFLADGIAKLDQDRQARLLSEARSCLDHVVDAFLKRPDFTDDPQVQDFFGLSRVIRDELSRGRQPGLPTPRAVEIGSHGDVTLTTPSGRDLVLPAAVLTTCLGTAMHDRYLDACRSGVMRFPSPVDGQLVDDVRGLALWHILTVWRCVDRRNDLVFFVLAAGFGAPVLSIWLPGADLVAHASDPHRREAPLIDGSHVAPVVEHLLEHGPRLLTFLGRPVGRFAHFTWPVPAVHVGHYHWNELPGLESITLGLAPRDYPLVYDLGGASGNCFYGTLALLFPELSDDIELSCTTYADMARHAYRHGVQPLRFGSAYVSAGIRRRIADVVMLAPAAAEAAGLRRESTGPILVAGLRVENRTVNELGAFYAELAKRIAARYGSLTLIIDGHNSKVDAVRDQTFTSYLEHRAGQQPVEVERQMVADLRSALMRHPVKIVDCVGMTLTDNLAWMRTADLCVAPWGAGLAKYRWALNLQTYVLVSNVCRLTKGDVHIYDGPENMETPSRQVYVSEALVTDRPDLPPLVPMDSQYTPYYVNYDVDLDGAVAEIIAELDGLSAARAGWARE